MTSQISSAFIAAGPVSKSSMRAALDTANAEITRLQAMGPFFLETTGGTASAITGSIGSGVTIPALTDGLTVTFRSPFNVNAGASFQLGALPPKVIRFYNDDTITTILGGQFATGVMIQLVYSLVDDCWILDMLTGRTSSIVERWGVTGEAATLVTGTGVIGLRSVGIHRITGVRASLRVASSSGVVRVDVKFSGVSIFSTTLTIDANELTSVTAATPAVLSTTLLGDDVEILTDILAAGTGAQGLKMALIGIPA